ncbi:MULTISPECIES: type II toxin-antitoxin system RelE/ParE family toxin [unclassified Pseudoalteromonas]|jgi:toxin ParE1/3/4|uniref:type II toxin-antitoxin system RelE/ParE family toxin n=1 Tax=unclassified Pseudoalteromonas TaxID=194690 RepID=UPI0016044D5F|nr:MULTISPECIES: type II toxin-antitoxin system RelE/ParE family toxin [unclassified Pseudoalteromonas]MBB1293110.1 type II toxin-antitoxin system RelE/ParE family toxin [Pseudoalteromonas sp. SR41-4]MBB1333684.1 type II toxin-antitoxin system RelE/ParE family toxin [Pseudoalteromonas sp. SR41-6]MBB1341596.1 type II toxin-antitoxin system RelE/ParE family toxin [Pseudoalteromonas sp. SR45-6]MBB1461586.1 type II toxin-antitoxin system RelE/ParE family toxin [Pseudoalteromonas sp. SG41-8]MBB1505
MAEIIWTNPALEDLNDIAEYIALSNLLSAKKLVAKIFAKVERLEEFPESGKTPIELSNLNYREVIVNPCRIFYKIDNDKIFILHIMRQERDLRKFLLQM